MYVIEEEGHAVVIDPGKNIKPGKDLLIDLQIVTHEHYDHISGVNLWKKTYRAPLLCSASCGERITDPRKNQARYFQALCEMQTWIKLECLPEIDCAYSCKADKTFVGEMIFIWQNHQIHLIEIPGHSPGSIGIFIDHTDFFSGDSLLKNQEIELRFPGGSRMQWKQFGEPVIKSIPKGTRIWPGHFEGFVLL